MDYINRYQAQGIMFLRLDPNIIKMRDWTSAGVGNPTSLCGLYARTTNCHEPDGSYYIRIIIKRKRPVTHATSLSLSLLYILDHLGSEQLLTPVRLPLGEHTPPSDHLIPKRHSHSLHRDAVPRSHTRFPKTHPAAPNTALHGPPGVGIQDSRNRHQAMIFASLLPEDPGNITTFFCHIAPILLPY